MRMRTFLFIKNQTMQKHILTLLALCGMALQAGGQTDSLALQEVVVTGTRHATETSRLPMNVTVVTREQLGTPEYVDYLGIRWQQGPFAVHAGTQHVSNYYTGSATAPYQTFTLVNASLAYSPLSSLKLWVRGENLMRQHYELLDGYPMPLATFMAGVNVDF